MLNQIKYFFYFSGEVQVRVPHVVPTLPVQVRSEGNLQRRIQ